MRPVNEMSEEGSIQAFSQAALPNIVQPASNILVTTGASYSGTHSPSVGFISLRHLTPARAILSLTATVLPLRSELVGVVAVTVQRVAQPPLSLSVASFGT